MGIIYTNEGNITPVTLFYKSLSSYDANFLTVTFQVISKPSMGIIVLVT